MKPNGHTVETPMHISTLNKKLRYGISVDPISLHSKTLQSFLFYLIKMLVILFHKLIHQYGL